MCVRWKGEKIVSASLHVVVVFVFYDWYFKSLNLIPFWLQVFELLSGKHEAWAASC
jgi:hypothetical protein